MEAAVRAAFTNASVIPGARSSRHRHSRLRRIDAALERMAAGGYGEGVSCGEPVAPKRLLFDPGSPRCLACAEAEE